jgi:serine/threonine-protein kinase
LAALDQPAIAISPDGMNLVYVAAQDRGVGTGVSPVSQEQAGRPVATGTQQLFLRPLDSQEAKSVAGTEGAVGPFFSSDGQWIGFFAGGKLKKVSVSGGAAVTLANAPSPGGASWVSQGTLALQGTRAGQGLQQVSEGGGTPQPLTRLAEGEALHRWPEVLPGGKAVLFAGSPNFAVLNDTQVAVQPIGAGDRKNLVQGATQPRYAATGHLLYAQNGTLMAAPFDAQRLALTGVAVPILKGMVQSAPGAAQYSISSTGTLVYLAGEPIDSQSRLVWVGRNGEEQPLPAAPRSYTYPRLSPDGRRVVVGIAEQERQIWVYDVSRDTLSRLTFEGNANVIPAWSRDGRQVAFRSNRAGGPGSLFWQASDGSDAAERLTTSESAHAPNSFSPDGQLLAFTDQRADTGRDIWMMNLKDRKAQPFLRTPYEETAPEFSPDGKWLAYSSNESGRREIYVQPYPGPGGKWQISTDGGQEPLWNPNGGELFYRSGSKMMAVEIDTKFGFSASKPKVLFEGPYLPTNVSFRYYDVSRDGQRFLMLKPVESQTSDATQINVVLNWFEELKRTIPVK